MLEVLANGGRSKERRSSLDTSALERKLRGEKNWRREVGSRVDDVYGDLQLE